MEYRSKFNIMLLNNYFIWRLHFKHIIWKYSKRLPLFIFEKNILNHFNISETNIISVEAAKVTQ